MEKWISIKDRLPELSTECIVYCPHTQENLGHGYVAILYYFIGSNKWQDVEGDEYFPTHWQPLPKPPKE